MPDQVDPARKAAKEILLLIKNSLAEQLPFIQFHDLKNNDVNRVAAIIARHWRVQEAELLAKMTTNKEGASWPK